jgi:photosystem II stability/assembly factor-like uncharacterized protein
MLWIFIFSNTSSASEFWKPTEKMDQITGDYEIKATDNGIIFVQNALGSIYKSTDDGKSWNKIEYNYYLRGMNYNNISSRMVTDNNGNLFFCAHNGVYKLLSTESTPKLVLYSSDNSFNTKDATLNISSDGKTIVFFNTNQIWVSNDAGENWQAVCTLKDEVYEIFSASYDDNYGIIQNAEYGSWMGIEPFVSHTIDNGNKWKQIESLPGLDSIVGEIKVLDSESWLINCMRYIHSNNEYYLYNPIKKTANKFDFQSYYKLKKNKNGYYLAADSSVYQSKDDGKTWELITSKVFPEYIYGWVDAFDVTPNGNIYAGTRYGGLKKSTDNGKTWVFTPFISDKGFDYTFNSKYTDKGLFIWEYDKNLLRSTDYGKSWSNIITDSLASKRILTDINKKGDIVYTNFKTIMFSNDLGKSFKMLDTTGIKSAGYSSIDILNNGNIILATQYSGSYFYENDSSKPVYKSKIGGSKFKLLSNGKLLSQINGGLLIIDSNKENYSSVTIPNGFGGYYDILSYDVSSNDYIFVGTEYGAYLSLDGVNFNKIGLDKMSLIRAYFDDNGYIYALSDDGNLFYSKDLDTNWIDITSDKHWIYDAIAFDKGKVFIKNENNSYYGDINDKLFLSIKDTMFVKEINDPYFMTFYKNDEVNYSCIITDNNGNLIKNAKVLIYNTLLNKTDTVITDINGTANLKFKITEKFNNGITFNLIVTAQADNYVNSSPSVKNLSYYNQIRDLVVRVTDHFYLEPKMKANIDYFVSSERDGFKKETAVLYIHNEYLNNADNFVVNANFNYTFVIDSNAKAGIYKITAYAKKDTITSSEIESYLLIVRKTKVYDGGSVAEILTESLDIYPNPANDFIYLKQKSDNVIDYNDIIEIYDISGNQLITFPIIKLINDENLIKVDISNLNSGVYFVKSGKVFGKFVKQ